MKSKILICTVLLLVFQLTYSQNTVDNKNKDISISNTNEAESINFSYIEFDHIYFILGTLNDYMSRFQYVDRENQVDRYYPFEKPLIDYLTRYIKTELNLEVDTTFEKSNRSKMYSGELSKILNSLYGKQDELINSKFETNNQIYSFLTGVYYRYGEKLDTSIYKIQLANSPKHQNCYELLKRIGCEKIFYKYLRNIPAQFILYFEPTDELKKYLDIIESERLILKESYYRQIEEMMKEHLTKEEIEKGFHKPSVEEVVNIKNAFKR